MEDVKPTGTIGEDLACEFLKNKRYAILGRNYRRPWGEIDIIAKSKDGLLIFVEVKTLVLRDRLGLAPEDNLTKEKLKKLVRICEMCANQNSNSIDTKKGWRLDLIAVEILAGAEKESLTILNNNVKIKHYENILA